MRSQIVSHCSPAPANGRAIAKPSPLARSLRSHVHRLKDDAESAAKIVRAAAERAAVQADAAIPARAKRSCSRSNESSAGDVLVCMACSTTRAATS